MARGSGREVDAERRQHVTPADERGCGIEAMAYTRTNNPNAVWHKLAERIPLAIVTNGRGRRTFGAASGSRVTLPR